MDDIDYAEVYTAYVHDGTQTTPVWCMRDKQSDHVMILSEGENQDESEKEME